MGSQPDSKRVLAFVPLQPRPRRSQGSAVLLTLIVDILDLGIQGLDWLKHKLQPPEAEIIDVSLLAEAHDQEAQKELEDKLQAIEQWSHHLFNSPDVPGEQPRVRWPRLRKVIVEHMTSSAEVSTLTSADIAWAYGWIRDHLVLEFERMIDVPGTGVEKATRLIQAADRKALHDALTSLLEDDRRREPNSLRHYAYRHRVYMTQFFMAMKKRGIQRDSTNYQVLEDLMTLAWLGLCSSGMKLKWRDEDYASVEQDEDSSPTVRRAGPGRSHLSLVKS